MTINEELIIPQRWIALWVHTRAKYSSLFQSLRKTPDGLITRGAFSLYRGNMSQGIFYRFYSSAEWKACRDSYVHKVGGLCELCKERGKITPGEIVHHKTHITSDNIYDPSVTLSHDNLLLVCRKHHAELHGSPKRYTIGEDGTVYGID